MSAHPLNYAERMVLLERIERLEAELLIERALNANLQTGLDTLIANMEIVQAELRRWQSDAMTDHEVRSLGMERTPEGLQMRPWASDSGA